MAQAYPSSISGTSGSASQYVGDLPAGAMAMRATNTVAPSGGGASGSGTNKLWLPLWSGEVIHAYDQYNMFENMINTKNIAGGFSYEFPITGTVDLEPAWYAGQELFGTGGGSKTFKVNLDARPMAAHFETDNIDLLVTQWDYRSELARQAGLTLANTRDRQIAMALVAAGTVGPITSDPRGSAFTTNAFHAPGTIATDAPSACTESGALAVLQRIEDYLVTCQENDVAVVDVYCAVTPKVFQVIRALGIPRTMTNGNNASYGQLFGGGDDFKAGSPLDVGMNLMSDTLDYMGVKIIKTNHLPKVDHISAANSLGAAKYNLDCSGFGVYGVIFQKEAVAGLSLQGMKVDTVQDVRRNTQFTVASMLKGTGVIRPELVKLLVGGTTLTSIDTRTEIATLLGSNFTNGFAAEYANI